MNLDKVIEFINSYKNTDLSKKKYGEVFTPFDLIDEMLDTLPEDVWSRYY